MNCQYDPMVPLFGFIAGACVILGAWIMAGVIEWYNKRKRHG